MTRLGWRIFLIVSLLAGAAWTAVLLDGPAWLVWVGVALNVCQVAGACIEGRAYYRLRPFDPDWTVAPGETLREWRQENALTVQAAATRCAWMPRDQYERIEEGLEPITSDIALALAHGTGISARMWMNLERRYRADLKAGKTCA